MVTQSGIHITTKQIQAPSPDDIAIQSGRITRYGGAVWAPLLRHIILVGAMSYRRTGRPADLIWGLLHDAHEVVTGEIVRPFKCGCNRHYQDLIDRLIIKQYNLQTADRSAVKLADQDACDIEAVQLNVRRYVELTLESGRLVYANSEDILLFWKIHRTFKDTVSTNNAGALFLIEVLNRALIQHEMAADYFCSVI